MAWGLAVLLFAATAALFWPATGYEFVDLDDYHYIPENPMVANGFSWESVRWAFTEVHGQWWAPLLWLSYMADQALCGPGPFGHHAGNILLHALNAALLCAALRRLTGSCWRSAFVAAWFAWHPLRVESVAWIAERKDVLSGLFFFLALWAHARQAERPSPIRLAAVVFLMLLGSMAKSILVVLPILLLLLDYWPLGRTGAPLGPGAWRRWRPLLAEKLPLLALAVAVGGITLWNNIGTGAGRTDGTWMGRLALVAPNYWAYVGNIFWPANLAVLYPTGVGAPGMVAVGAALGMALVTVWAWRVRSRLPFVLVGWLWFLVALLPVVRGVRFDEQSALSDRYTYLPAIGVGLVLAWAAGEWVQAGARRGGDILRRRRRLAALAGGAVLLASAVLTSRQLPVWRNSGTLFARVLQHAPMQLQANLNYGLWLWGEGREDEALHHYRRAWAVSGPNRPDIMGGAAREWVMQGRAQEAKAILTPAMEEPRPLADLQGTYGMACLHAGELASAIWHLRRARELDPQSAEFRVELIRALFESGADDQARAQAAQFAQWPGGEIRTAEDLFPFYLQRWRDGARPYAWGYFRRLAERQPGSAATLNNLAWLVATDADAPPDAVAEAVDLAARAVRLADDGTRAALLDTLAAAQAAAGDFPAALETAHQARDLARRQGLDELALNIEGRLAAYRRQRPWRE
jgi:protein O-mannosyl-transferase